MILCKKADINLPKLKSELFGIFDSLAYEYYDWDEVSKGKHYNSISVRKRESSIDDKSLIIYIYNTFDPKESIQFNWIDEKLERIWKLKIVVSFRQKPNGSNV